MEAGAGLGQLPEWNLRPVKYEVRVQRGGSSESDHFHPSGGGADLGPGRWWDQTWIQRTTNDKFGAQAWQGMGSR